MVSDGCLTVHCTYVFENECILCFFVVVILRGYYLCVFLFVCVGEFEVDGWMNKVDVDRI